MTYAAVWAGAAEESRAQLRERVDVAGVRLGRPHQQSLGDWVLLDDAFELVADVERRQVGRHAQTRRCAHLRNATQCNATNRPEANTHKGVKTHARKVFMTVHEVKPVQLINRCAP